MTLREEVLKHSGLSTEEILEEGRFKRALAIAAVIAAGAGAAIFGPKAVGEIKQFNRVKSVPVAARYEKVDDEINKKLSNREHFVFSYNFNQKLDQVKSIKSEYVAKENQAIVHVYVDNREHFISNTVVDEVEIALREYTFMLDDYYSKIEDKLTYSVNTIPLKVVVHFKNYLRIDNKKELEKAIYNSVWTHDVEIEAPKKGEQK